MDRLRFNGTASVTMGRAVDAPVASAESADRIMRKLSDVRELVDATRGLAIEVSFATLGDTAPGEAVGQRPDPGRGLLPQVEAALEMFFVELSKARDLLQRVARETTVH